MTELKSVKIGIYVVKSPINRKSIDTKGGSITSRLSDQKTNGYFIDWKSHQRFIDNIFSIGKDAR